MGIWHESVVQLEIKTPVYPLARAMLVIIGYKIQPINHRPCLPWKLKIVFMIEGSDNSEGRSRTPEGYKDQGQSLATEEVQECP